MLHIMLLQRHINNNTWVAFMPEKASPPMVFDAGSIISLTTNNLLWLLPPLKERFGGSFLITNGVADELIKKPLATRKYKLDSTLYRKWHLRNLHRS